MSDVLSAGYVLVVAEVRRGLFEERNLDTIGLGRAVRAACLSPAARKRERRR